MKKAFLTTATFLLVGFGMAHVALAEWAAPLALDTPGDVGFSNSLVVVNGNPAIAYLASTPFNDLKYIRAANAAGSSWNAPVTIDSTGDVAFNDCSLAIVNGNPAISYFDYTNRELKYVRAADADGATWNAPVTIDTNWLISAQHTSLAVVNGKPAISYGFSTDLKYVRASDADGTTWNTPLAIDTLGAVGASNSLAIVNGNPAISYWYGSIPRDLRYVRAADSDGTAWNAPVAIDTMTNVSRGTSLVVVNGKPAFSYVDGTTNKYVAAADADGTTWNATQVIDTFMPTGNENSLALIDDKPVIVYFDTDGLNYVRATDADGASWEPALLIDTAGDSGPHLSLAAVNGNPGICYLEGGELDLKYVYFVPEPSAFGLAFLGLIMFAGRRKKRTDY